MMSGRKLTRKLIILSMVLMFLAIQIVTGYAAVKYPVKNVQLNSSV